MRVMLKCVFAIALLTGISSVRAADVDLDAENPAIQKIKTRMSERAAKIGALKDNGAVGEDSTGFLKDRQTTGLSLTEKKEVRDLVVSENEDRSALFRELRIANNLPDSELESVAKAFAAARRTAASDTHWVEDPATKKWMQKAPKK
jgi:uncharacterized protein